MKTCTSTSLSLLLATSLSATLGVSMFRLSPSAEMGESRPPATRASMTSLSPETAEAHESTVTSLSPETAEAHESTVQSVPEPLLVPNRVLEDLPFSDGEEVLFEINWKPIFLFPAFKAGELRLAIQKDSYQDSPAYKISAWASSGGLLKSVAKLDVRDYFESIIDGQDLKSHRFVHRKRQNQTRRDLEVTFDYSNGRRRIREVDLSQDPPRQLRDEVHTTVPETVVDTLSVFYAARFRPLEPGSLYRIHLSDGGSIKDVTVRVERRERIRIAMGRFDSVRISTQGQIFRGAGDFRIWYSTDELRIPLKFEADVKFGRVYGQILQLQSRYLTRSVVRNEE